MPAELKIIAAILETPVIERILEHRGLPARALLRVWRVRPIRMSARYFDDVVRQFDTSGSATG